MLWEPDRCSLSSWADILAGESPELFWSCKSETLFHLNNKPLFLSPQLLIAVILLSISVNLMTLDTSYKRNHTVFVFCDWLISLNIMFSWSIHVAAHKYSIPFENWIIFHCMHMLHFAYSFIWQWTLGLLPPLGYSEWYYELQVQKYIKILKALFSNMRENFQKWDCSISWLGWWM